MDSNWRPKEGWKNPIPEAFWEAEDESSPDNIWEAIYTLNTLNGFGHDAYEAGASAIIPAVREATLKEVGESGVRIKLASCDGKPVAGFDDGDFVDQTGALVDLLMHLSILMPNAELDDDLTIIPTKILRGEMPEEEV